MNCTDPANCTVSSTSPSIGPPTTFFVSNVVIGVIGIFVNIITITVIRKNKKMRSPCFILIGGASFGSLLVALAYAITASAKLGDRFGTWSLSNRTRGTCLLSNLYILGMAAFPFSGVSVVLVGLDRLYGTLAPLKYRLVGKRYAIVGLCSAGASSVIEAIALISAGPPFDQIVPNCGLINAAFGQGPFLAFTDINLALHSFNVLAYTAVLISGQIRKWKMKQKAHGGFGSAGKLQHFLKQQAAVTPAAKLLFLLYLVTAVAPAVAFNIIPVTSVFYGIAVQLNTTCPIVEFVSLSLRCKEFRNGLRQMINVKGKQGNPMAGENGPKTPSVKRGWM